MTSLHKTLENYFGTKNIPDTIVPKSITDNLRFDIREYQKEAFQRFHLLYNHNFEGKPGNPLHLLYNMATGSGKTLIMAGLMLYLYEQGYRNFLFFVHSTNIIHKSKINFLEKDKKKYLFNKDLHIESKDIFIKEVENFEEADNENINIKFTTTHKLHSDLRNSQENSITYEDFKDKKIILIGDEAHHLNASTRNQKKLFTSSWESTVEKILKSCDENILLEFTATLDESAIELVKKYDDKIIYKYDLVKFRDDKYSKEIKLIRSDYEKQERVIQALIINLYRQEVAAHHGINLKPVILFKAKNRVPESEKNKEWFHKLIDNLSPQMIEEIRVTSTIQIIEKAFKFFKNNNLANSEICKRIKSNFKEENCLSANEKEYIEITDKEAKDNQIKLNTLEDENNPIRAVFAVYKLNEGWDVLNLFDIVRMYEKSAGTTRKPGKSTISEAQLIGRGARYYHFPLEEHDKYKRKFDSNLKNDLRVIEELYYHAKDEHSYISELKAALKEIKLDLEKSEIKKLVLKESFKKTNFYKTGKVFFNKKIARGYKKGYSFDDLEVKKSNFEYTLPSGRGEITDALDENQIDIEHKTEEMNNKKEDISVSEIPQHIVRYAMSKNSFYYFNNLKKYFPDIDSLSDFINSKDYMGGLEIIFAGIQSRLSNIKNKYYLNAIEKLLNRIEEGIKSQHTEYEGSEFTYTNIYKKFGDKEITVEKDSVRSNGEEEQMAQYDWYAYNSNYGTKEEKKFVELFARSLKEIKSKFTDIYVIRNERELKIVDDKGRTFEPDFILFCKKKEKDKKGKELTYQVFIEPKGRHLIATDKWKEELLEKIRKDENTIKIDGGNYLITAVPFYNHIDENKFKEKLLENTLKIQTKN